MPKPIAWGSHRFEAPFLGTGRRTAHAQKTTAKLRGRRFTGGYSGLERLVGTSSLWRSNVSERRHGRRRGVNVAEEPE